MTAAATIGIAATPMESSVGGAPHVVAAGLTYASLAATPLLASHSLSSEGRRGATASALVGVAAGAGRYHVAILGAGITLVVLLILAPLERAVERRANVRHGVGDNE